MSSPDDAIKALERVYLSGKRDDILEVLTILRALAAEREQPIYSWVPTELERPEQGSIVLVHGGIAQYRNGVFYTGMDNPPYQRVIQWSVTHWMKLPVPPLSAVIEHERVAEQPDLRPGLIFASGIICPICADEGPPSWIAGSWRHGELYCHAPEIQQAIRALPEPQKAGAR